MNMMVSTTPSTSAPPLPGKVVEAVPALPGSAAAAPFADFMGLELIAVATEADADAPPAEDAAAAPEPAASDLQAQEHQQALSSMQLMMLSMPVTMAMPAPMAAAQALPAADGEASGPAVDAAAPVAIATGTGNAFASLAAPQASAAPMPAAGMPAAPTAQPQQASAAAAEPAFAAALSRAAAAPAAQAAVVADAPVAADAPAAPVSAAGATTTAPVAAASSELKLAAARPADWQQPLREALGDRLQLQLSRNIDLAVIRLDPPNLGRIEIAIRHMAGTLEVNISATHREVVRQLNTISDTMRTDLAQRQFTEVAVNVTTATRNAAGSQQAFDQQGRQRQQDGAAEESVPGRALAEAGNPSSTFSLNARESYA